MVKYSNIFELKRTTLDLQNYRTLMPYRSYSNKQIDRDVDRKIDRKIYTSRYISTYIQGI